jgi:hypothetical protein
MSDYRSSIQVGTFFMSLLFEEDWVILSSRHSPNHLQVRHSRVQFYF